MALGLYNGRIGEHCTFRIIFFYFYLSEQDPDVLETPLPKCLLERKKQLTIIRPPNPDKSPILRVERPIRSRDPSPCSSKQSSPLQHPSPRHHQAAMGWGKEREDHKAATGGTYPREDGGVGCDSEVTSIPTPSPSTSSMTFTNKSYGLNDPTERRSWDRGSFVQDDSIDSLQRSSSIPPVLCKGYDSEQCAAERSSLLNSVNSDTSDQERKKVEKRFSNSSPRPKHRTSSLILPAPPKKRQLMRGLSWNHGSGESPDVCFLPDLQRPASLPGLSDPATPDLLTSEVTKGSQPNGKRSVKRSLSGGGSSLKQKLSQRLSREGKTQDSKPLVETNLDEVILSEQGHVTHTDVWKYSSLAS